MFSSSESPTAQHARRLIALDAPGMAVSAPASSLTASGLGLTSGVAPTTSIPASAAMAGFVTPAAGRGPSLLSVGAGAPTPRDLQLSFDCASVLAPSWLRGGSGPTSAAGRAPAGGFPSGSGALAPPPPPPPAAPERDSSLADVLQGCSGPRGVPPASGPSPGIGQFGKSAPPAAPSLLQLQPELVVENVAQAWLASTSPDVAARPVLQLLAQYPTMTAGIPTNMVPVVLQRLASLRLIVPSALRAPEAELLRS